MRVFRAVLPVAAVLAFLILLGVGAAAVAVVSTLVIGAALVLVCNPFGLLDRTMAVKARWCMAVGLLSVLAACILPLGWPVSLALVALAFGLIWYGCRFNRTLLEDQRGAEPEGGVEVHRGLYYSPRTNHALSALRAQDKGWEMDLWEKIGKLETQTLLMMRGVAFTEEELDKMRYAFLSACTCVRRENARWDDAKKEIKTLREQLGCREREIAELRQQAEEQVDEYLDAREQAEEYSRRLDQAEAAALRYAETLSQRGELTAEVVQMELANGKTGEQIAAEYGVSRSKVSRLRNGR